MPKLSEVLFGKKDKVKQIDTMTPEQQELMSLINEGLTSGTGPFAEMFGKFNEQEFQEGVANPAMKQFQDDILPQIQEKFIANNQALGSGMQRAQVKGASDLQAQLAQLLYGAKQQHKQNRMGGLQNLLGLKSFENLYKEGDAGAVAGFAKNFASSAGKTLGNKMFGGGGGGGGGSSSLDDLAAMSKAVQMG